MLVGSDPARALASRRRLARYCADRREGLEPYGAPTVQRVVTDTEACMRGVVLAVGAVVLGACSGDGGIGTDERQAAIYAAVIDDIATESGSGEGGQFDGPVYVVASPGHEIGIEVQAEVVEQLDDRTIRFVDEREEAIEESDDEAPVLGDGLLVTLGKIRGSGGRRTVAVRTYLRLGDDERQEVTLEGRGDRWAVTEKASRER
jgi:hypothetical protein